MPEWNYHPGEALALQVYNPHSEFSQTAELGGNLFIIWGDTHSTFSLLSNKWNLTLHVSWASSGSQLWKLTPCTWSEKGLGGSSGCIAEFSVRDKARQWHQSWPGILLQAGNLYSVHLFMLLFVFLSAVAHDSCFSILMAGLVHHHQTSRKSLTSSPNAVPFPRPVHGKGGGGGLLDYIKLLLQPYRWVRKTQFLERHYAASKSPNSPHKWVTSSVASAMLKFKFWQWSP